MVVGDPLHHERARSDLGGGPGADRDGRSAARQGERPNPQQQQRAGRRKDCQRRGEPPPRSKLEGGDRGTKRERCEEEVHREHLGHPK